MIDPNVDPELLATFLDESEESLQGVSALFVELESNPQNIDIIQAIFRPVHSLKGNASFFNLLVIKNLAHELETLLDQMRQGNLSVSTGIINTLLRGADALTDLINYVRDHENDQGAMDTAGLIQEVQDHLSAVTDKNPAADAEIIRRILPEDNPEALAAFDRLCAAAGISSGQATEPVDEKPLPESVIAGMMQIRQLLVQAREEALKEEASAQLVNLFEEFGQAGAEAGLAAEEAALVTEIVEGIAMFAGSIGVDEAAADFLSDLMAKSAFVQRIETAAGEQESSSGGEEKSPDQSTAEVENSPSHSKQAKKDVKTMRIPEQSIDTFLHYVGELVVVGDMYRHLQATVLADPGLQELARQFRRANETFGGLSNQLQKSIMGIRKVPLRPLTQKIPRMVRDLSQAIGKEVNLEITGEDLEVDKSLIDLLDAPLTHMIRNGIDHGIETPEARDAVGKNPIGTLKVNFEENSGFIVLSIKDDGAGLNLDAIRNKALELDLIKEGATLEEQDIVNMIFLSGVSTADKVTDISGRGVGMDVVRRAIEQAGGNIGVSTEAGLGSTFSIALPKGVTTQIVGGYLVSCGDLTYVLPMDRVRETFRSKESELKTVSGRGRCVIRREQVIPVAELNERLGGPPSVWPRLGLPIVVVEANKRLLALVVDGVLGVHKVVIREIQGLPVEAPSVSGAALLGDGRLALVIDVDALKGE